MNLVLATKQNASKLHIDDWDNWDELGRYDPDTKTILVPKNKAFISHYRCSEKTSKLLVLVSCLHEFGHHYHRHQESTNETETDAWLYVFRCIKPSYHNFVWIAFDYIFSDTKPDEYKKTEMLRDAISIGLS